MAKKPPTTPDKHPDNRTASHSRSEEADGTPAGKRQLAMEVMEVSWQGPIPPPQVLRQINEVVPDGAERVFAQFENETKHRHLRERRAQTFPLFDQLLGRITALIFALACLGVAVYAIDRGYPWVAVAFGAATIAIGVNAFLRQSARSEPPARRPSEKKK